MLAGDGRTQLLLKLGVDRPTPLVDISSVYPQPWKGFHLVRIQRVTLQSLTVVRFVHHLLEIYGLNWS